MIIEARGGCSLWSLLHYCVHWDGIFCACPLQIVGLGNQIPPPAKLETTLNFKRHESSPIRWSVWNSYRLDGTKLFLGSQEISYKHRLSPFLVSLFCRYELQMLKSSKLSPLILYKESLCSSHRVQFSRFIPDFRQPLQTGQLSAALLLAQELNSGCLFIYLFF